MVYRVDGSKLIRIEGQDEQVYSGGAPSFSPPVIDLILLNKAIQSEADLKELLIFASSDEDEMCNSRRNQMDLQGFVRSDGSLNTKEISKNAGSKMTDTVKYEQEAASGLGLGEDISENFNFKRIITLSTQPQAAQFLSQEGIEIVTLQTLE